MNDYGTASKNNESTTFKAEGINELIQHLRVAKEIKEFILISPTGILYKGTADKLVPILLKDFSFLTNPTAESHD